MLYGTPSDLKTWISRILAAHITVEPSEHLKRWIHVICYTKEDNKNTLDCEKSAYVQTHGIHMYMYMSNIYYKFPCTHTHTHAHTHTHTHTTIQCTCNIPCVQNTQSSSHCLSQHPRPKLLHAIYPLGAQVHAHAVWERTQ